MIGAIVGDIVGSRFEWKNIKTKTFDFFSGDCFFTDDTVLSLAVCESLLKCKKDYSDLGDLVVMNMQRLAQMFPGRGYGRRFSDWVYEEIPSPYDSFGNGAAMRVSGCGYVANSVEEVKMLSRIVTEKTHNHPEGLKGAEAVAMAVFLARTGTPKDEIKKVITEQYYPLDFTLAEIRNEYTFNETCQGSVPQALEAFFESINFEDAVRNAVSIGGDSDTIAAMTGSVAEAYYGVPGWVRTNASLYLDVILQRILWEFELHYPSKKV